MITAPETWRALKANFEIEEAYNMLNLQGWDKLEVAPTQASPEMIKAFYSNMKPYEPADQNSPSEMVVLKWNKKSIFIPVTEFADVIGLTTSDGSFNFVAKRIGPGVLVQSSVIYLEIMQMRRS